MALIRNKKFFAQFFIVLLVSQSLLQNIAYHPSQFSGVVSAVERGNAGMQLRLEQKTINSFKKAMEFFLPHYLNVDANLPQEYHYEFGTFFDLVRWEFDWTDIKYSQADLDIKDVEIQMEQLVDVQVLKVKFPAIKHWEIDAHQHVNNVILPSDSPVRLVFENFEFNFHTDFKLD